MDYARFVAASFELSLAEQRIAGSLELARHRGDAVAVRSLEQAGNHLCSLRAILTADRLATLGAGAAEAEGTPIDQTPGAWAQPPLPFAVGAK